MNKLLLVLLAAPSLALSQNQGMPVVTLAEARQRSVSIDPDAVAARSRVDVASSERRAAFTNLITPNLRADYHLHSFFRTVLQFRYRRNQSEFGERDIRRKLLPAWRRKVWNAEDCACIVVER